MSGPANIGPIVAADRCAEGHLRIAAGDLSGRTFSSHALRSIDSEQSARRMLERVRDGIADPDELAALIAGQPDAVALVAFCRVVQKQLEARHA